MKANEAPEKLYILFNHPYTVDYTKLNKRRCEEEVEYTHTDAFIDKAATWFANRYQVNGYLDADDIEDFKNYMKGE